MWSARRKINPSNYTINKVTNNRRRRNGRQSFLYTRFRQEEDPWNGSPAKTPPSSDDEHEETPAPPPANTSSYAHGNTRSHSHSSHARSRDVRHPVPGNNMKIENVDLVRKSSGSKDAKHARKNENKSRNQHTQQQQQAAAPMRTEYMIPSNLSNLSLSSGLTGSSAETVAPAPIIIHAQSEIDNTERRRRVNEVKRKISQYVKMENANVLQSAQFTRKQTKLQVKKTAPVPLPFTYSIGEHEIVDSKKAKIRAITHKQKQWKQGKKSKGKQKQTAMVPLPPHLQSQSNNNNNHIHSKHKSKASAKTASSSSLSSNYKSKQQQQHQHQQHLVSKVEVTATAPVITDSTPTEFQCDYNTEYSLPSCNLSATSSPYFSCLVTPPPASHTLKSMQQQQQQHHQQHQQQQQADASITMNSAVTHSSLADATMTPVDFDSIPEAYYIGFDSAMDSSLTANPFESQEQPPPPQQKQQQRQPHCDAVVMVNDMNVLDMDIEAVQKEVNDDFIQFTAINSSEESSHSNELIKYSETATSNEDIVIDSPISGHVSSNEPEHVLMDNLYSGNMAEFTTSNSSLHASKAYDDDDEEEEDEVAANKADANVLFTDHNFNLLAEQILDEKQPSSCAQNVAAVGAPISTHLTYPNHSNYHSYEPYQMPPPAHIAANNYRQNIWAEPRRNQATTLGGLLMNGLPPISKQFFQ